MSHKEALLGRLEAIGRSLAETEGALALLGLGSAGGETARMDAYSDLDFFVIVQTGYKTTFVQDLSWLTAVAPVAYHFQNTPDGHKLLFRDGVFCEFAVFDPAELAAAAYAAPRLIWQAPGFVGDWLKPEPAPPTRQPAAWLLGEALTNLYVGLGRYRRGEKLSAARFVQGYALDRVLDLAAYIETEQPAFRDPFSPERRFEQRFPDTAVHLPQFMQGYEYTVPSALAILRFLDDHFTINPALKRAIEALCDEDIDPAPE